MNILFITDNFPPEVNAPATRTYEHCREWVDEGHEVTVITCAPNFPQGEVYEGYQNKWHQKEEVDGIEVIRVWSYITSNEGFIKRTLDYFSFAVTSFWSGLSQKPDIIIATSPQFFTTWSGWALSKFKRKPWVFEVRDLWPESIKTVGALKEGFIYDSLESIELFLYRSADKVIPVTDAFKKNLSDRGISPGKQLVIPNGSNLELFDVEASDGRGIREELGLKNKFVVGYVGTHGMAHNLDFILECAGQIEDLDIHFLFIGDGSEKESLLKIAEEEQLKNVTFVDPIPKEKVPDYLDAVDVSLVPLKKSDTFKTVIPSKIFEAASMELPILLGVEGQAQEIVEEYEAGICFEPENKDDLLEKLGLLKRDKELYKRISRNGAKLAKAYDRKILARKMLDALEELV
ncbi:glycosyltransferase WbuB [Aliifodinibius salipaludis]|uniref:Glycosyltransferase WbuB n=1 Tax=Fodinibius salipaludis TaxID=2032627 RepID=A0A2A2G8J9_9BACT|nr:glycosyltransferase family 4 protein [Aliifodinibius salipaludis]PAU93162.1 glycosyltransferase WbuB [Aliifodinibius salipaludis]